jgi:hypothetical protein
MCDRVRPNVKPMSLIWYRHTPRQEVSELADNRSPQPRYDAPQIESRHPLADPLIGTTSGTPAASARFRPTEQRAVYESPQIEAREPLTAPLIGGPAASGGVSAAFRTAYERPQIAERTKIESPLVAVPPSGAPV